MNCIKIKILFFLFFSGLLSAQVKSNYELINELVDSSASKIVSGLDRNIEYKLNFRTIDEYSSLNNRLLNALGRKSISINDSEKKNKIFYSINNAGVEYSNLFKDGILGDYFLERKIFINGEYEIINKSVLTGTDLFNIAIVDTIPFNKISFVENSSLPFTKGEKPTEPFFPSIVEPVIAVATVVVTAILFFSVRSK